MYGYATPFDMSINYGWGEIDSNCNQAPAKSSFGFALRAGGLILMAVISVLAF